MTVDRMGSVSGNFGFGAMVGFVVFNTAGAYLMGVFDRAIGSSAMIRFSIVLVVILTGCAAVSFSMGLRRGDKMAEWRAALLGLTVTVGYWILVAIATALLAPFSMELPVALAVIPFLIVCGISSRFVRASPPSIRQ